MLAAFLPVRQRRLFLHDEVFRYAFELLEIGDDQRAALTFHALRLAQRADAVRDGVHVHAKHFGQLIVGKRHDGDVLYQATGTFPRTRLAFRPMLCNHCEDPACVKHCPTHAMHKDAETGLVLVDQDRCIACGYCTWTCPYGAPSMDDVHHVMSKCTFCKDRISEGQKPFCAEACPANARVFGDLNDPESEPSKLLQQKKGVQYLPEMGTNPSVYYV